MEDAIAEFHTAIRLDPDNALPHLSLGIVLERKGDRFAALEEIEKARELDPNDTSIAKAYERMRRKAGNG